MTIKDLKEAIEKSELSDDTLVKIVEKGLYGDFISLPIVECKDYISNKALNFFGIIAKD